MSTQSWTWIEGLKSERLCGCCINHFPHIDTHAIKQDFELVDPLGAQRLHAARRGVRVELLELHDQRRGAEAADGATPEAVRDHLLCLLHVEVER